jgi:acyl carrier protein
MSNDEVLAALKRILEKDFRVPPHKVTLDASFRGTLGLDSLDAIDLIYLVGKSFNIKAPVEDFRELHTVRRVIDYVVAKAAEAPAKPPAEPKEMAQG